MNDTRTQLSDAAWSKLESLSSLRKFLQQELEHANSFPSGPSDEQLVKSLYLIDSFSNEITGFLNSMNYRHLSIDAEDEFDELSERYAGLMHDLERIVER
jgi:hypothetical protein